MKSFFEATARQRVANILDAGSFLEFLPPCALTLSPHLEQLELPQSFDDGVIIGSGLIEGEEIFIFAQEGGFLGGAVGEVHGAKILGLLKRAIVEKPKAIIMLLDSGGVRLHEANAGLIGVSEIMRGVFDCQQAGIPVVSVIGSSNGCFGGMGIVASCADIIVMSEESRLSMSGPEVIETVCGVEEYDSRDRALVWRTTGGKHRYIMRDCDYLVADNFKDFRQIIVVSLKTFTKTVDPVESIEAEHKILTERFERFSKYKDALEIWSDLGIENLEEIPLLEIEEFLKVVPRKAGPLEY